MVKSDSDVIREFNELVNMSASELEKWLKSSDSTSSGWTNGDSGETVGHNSGTKIVDILKRNPDKKKDKYTEEDIKHMRKVVSYNKRHLAQERHLQEKKSEEELKKTKSYKSLKSKLRYIPGCGPPLSFLSSPILVVFPPRCSETFRRLTAVERNKDLDEDLLCSPTASLQWSLGVRLACSGSMSAALPKQTHRTRLVGHTTQASDDMHLTPTAFATVSRRPIRLRANLPLGRRAPHRAQPRQNRHLGHHRLHRSCIVYQHCATELGGVPRLAGGGC